MPQTPPTSTLTSYIASHSAPLDPPTSPSSPHFSGSTVCVQLHCRSGVVCFQTYSFLHPSSCSYYRV